MMLNKFGNYQQQQLPLQQQQPMGDATSPTHSADYAAAAKAERESIHSGQFMVSHFEAEEAQDDLEEYDEVKMLDPEDPGLGKSDDPANPCMELQVYVPRNQLHYQDQVGASPSMVTSHLEIETSLTKLFKCMNLAYSQKLTSPKWNHFKGVRLRWKDKIRLNNVIWRCWHMQFILKRKTPVCQFASPLDVDIHSNPQAVVLEGKYWKRQTVVIKAEYRKWRKNYKSKATGCLIYDTKSELDFLEWSPLNDRTLMLPEDWASDTLFSSINGPFPFPDPREIARGAGIADFMQPGLGSLQPNIDDIDLTTIDELLQPQRLPPVPEEGADEMLKSVDYGFSAIMGSDQMDSNQIIDVSTNEMNEMQTGDDANMIDLNAPVTAGLQFSEVDQQFTNRDDSNSFITPEDNMLTDERTSELLAEALGTSNTSSSRMSTKHFSNANENLSGRQNEFSGKSVMKGRISKNFQRPFRNRREPHNYDKAQPTMHQTSVYQQMLAEHQKSQQTLQQHLQPTMTAAMLQHQAMTFPQQPQTQQQQLQFSTAQYPSLLGGGNSNTTNAYNNFSGDLSSALSSTSRIVNSMTNVVNNNSKSKSYNVQSAGSMQNNQLNGPATSTPGPNILLSVKTEPDIISMYNLNAVNDVYGGSSGIGVGSNTNSNSYKPYPSMGNFKKSASTGTYINMRVNQSTNAYISDQSSSASPHMHAQSLPLSLGNQVPSLSNALQLQVNTQNQLSPSSSQQHLHQRQHPQTGQSQSVATTQQQQQQNGTTLMPKEMFRSNSLPLNATLQKLDVRSSHDNFVVPKYHAKSKPRSRSNSVHQHVLANSGGGGNNTPNNNNASNITVTPQLQAATSDPMLNKSTLAQLLTKNSRQASLGKQQSSSTSAISSLSIPLGASPIPVPPSSMQKVSGSTAHFFMSPPQCSPASAPLMSSLPATSNAPEPATDSLQRQTGAAQQLPQKSPKKSTSLPAQAVTSMIHNPPNKMLSYPLTTGSQAACTNAISLSPDSFHDQDSPLSPTHSLKFPRETQRRAVHIHAEQKRRYNIKNGFDVLHSLIPQLQQNPNAKLSKAAMLQKGADHIKHLRSERNQLNDRMEALLKERDALNNSLTHLHSILPANGAPVTRQGTEHVRQLYEQYVRHRTLENWKFWILGLILEPLLSSYTASVSSASMEELRRTAFLWVDQHCSLVDLRPAVSNKLKYLSMKTDILSDPPSTLQDEVVKAVHNTVGQHPNLHGS